MTSKIILENIKIYAYHGVLPEENIIGTFFVVNCTLETDFWKAAETDDLQDTVSYAEINDIIHAEMAVPSKLIEHAAGRILTKIHEKFPQVSSAEIKITKTNPPMKGEIAGASVLLQRTFKPFLQR